MKRLLLLIVVAIMSLQADAVLAEVNIDFDEATVAEAQAAADLGQKLLASEFTGKDLGPNGKTDVMCIEELESALRVPKGSIVDDRTNRDAT